MKNYLLLFLNKFHGKKFIFQQDNAAIHNSKLTKSWISQQKINVLKWPSKSLDLNPIENVWGYLARGLSKRKTVSIRSRLSNRHSSSWQGMPQKKKNIYI